MNKALGIILIALGLFGLAWGGLRKQPGRRSSTLDLFTRLARRRTMFHCRPMQAGRRLLPVSSSSSLGTGLPLGPARSFPVGLQVAGSSVSGLHLFSEHPVE